MPNAVATRPKRNRIQIFEAFWTAVFLVLGYSLLADVFFVAVARQTLRSMPLRSSWLSSTCTHWTSSTAIWSQKTSSSTKEATSRQAAVLVVIGGGYQGIGGGLSPQIFSQVWVSSEMPSCTLMFLVIDCANLCALLHYTCDFRSLFCVSIFIVFATMLWWIKMVKNFIE